MGNRRDIQTYTKSAKGKNNDPRPSTRHNKRDIRQGGISIRIIQERRVRHSWCTNPETQKGIGAVLFTLGIPSFIAGLIMTIVSVTDDDNENKYPRSFIATGPVLLAFSVVFFIIGILLHSDYTRKAFQDCFSLDNPDSFCRVRCPALSQCISPDDAVKINQSAIRALQIEPGKSVLKRNRLLSNPAPLSSNIDIDNNYVTSENNDVFYDVNVNSSSSTNDSNGIRMHPRGVHFSDGDLDDLNRKQTSSVTSDNGSLLSLKHCKIHPKNDIWWTDEQTKTKMLNNNVFKEETSVSLQTTEL